MAVGADLSFEVSVPGRDTVHGTLRGSRNQLTLDVDDVSILAGTAGSGASRALAQSMASNGVLVRVTCGDVHLASVGAVSAPWWQRRFTGSRRIRIGSLRGAWMSRSSLRGAADSLVPDLSSIPGTIFPLLPTFARRPVEPVATTHDLRRGGRARLVVLPGARSFEGEEQQSYRLLDPLTVIGSGEDCDIVLPGLLRRHAEVHQDEHDEFVLVAAEGADVRVNGMRGARLLLRTGSRVEVGTWAFGFTRQEHADHGRPFGGRSGGEAGYQRPQPVRGDGR